MSDVVKFLEDMLAKAKTGELDAVFVVASRKGVKTGAVAYVSGVGDWKNQHPKLRDSLRVAWASGMENFDWGHLNTTEIDYENAHFSRKKYTRRK